MIVFDKSEIKSNLSTDNIFDLLQEWGADPDFTDFGIISSTICHNHPGEGSKKLYYYENSGLFKCYTGCDASFDIFELTMKVFNIQHNQEMDLNDAVRYIAARFGIGGKFEEASDSEKLKDWNILSNYDRLQAIETNEKKILILKEYNSDILNRLNYKVRIKPWLDEGISQEALDQAKIGFYPGGNQITVPHFDKDGRFVGLRGRTLSIEDGERYGKYRPVIINQLLYNHPLGMNLYNLDKSKEMIKLIKKAIVFEGEKSCLLYKSYFGLENDISTACCGSSLSAHQVQLLIESGAEEIIVAFDRQFQEIGDEEFEHLKRNLIKLHEKYKNYVQISFMFDKHMITGYKSSPIDEGKDKFLQLFKERILL